MIQTSFHIFNKLSAQSCFDKRMHEQNQNNQNTHLGRFWSLKKKKHESKFSMLLTCSSVQPILNQTKTKRN